MSESVCLIGIDSTEWSDLLSWIERALPVLSRQNPKVATFQFGRVDPDLEQYSGGMCEPLGRLSRLQALALEVHGETPHRPSHLVSAVGRPGYYLPFDFPAPLLSIPRKGLLGAVFTQRLFVGSSVRLLEELDVLGPTLGMKQDAGQIGVEALEDMTEGGPRPAERFAWGMLRWFARLSVEKKVVVELG